MPVSSPLGPEATRPVTPSRFAGALKQPRVRNVAARSDRTYNGSVYDSKAEALHAFGLDALKSAGKIVDWERQIRFDLAVNGVKICKFIIDFKIVENNGHVHFEYKLKLKLFRALYPSLDYRLVAA